MADLALNSDRMSSRTQRAAVSLPAMAAAVLLAILVSSEPARAQNGFVVFTPNAAPADPNKSPPGFTLPAQTADMKDSLDEFERLAKHEQWEKAFKALETIAGKTTTGFIDRGDGVLVPSRLLLRGLLAGLSGAGKNAYRLFYDAQATALWDKATGAAEAENLNKIVNNHLISSVGDRAADRLGDLYFERGDFEQAVAAWQALYVYCPDTKIPRPQTLLKIATALARSGRFEELAALQQTLRDQFAGDAIEIGGRRIAAADEMTRLAALAKTDRPMVAGSAPLADDFSLPSEAKPLWQFAYQSKPDPTNSHQPFALMDVYGRQRPNDFFIPAAADERRVYTNLFGVEMAFDVETGKLLWRSGKLHLLQFQQNRQNAMPERYSILVTGDRTWSVLRDAQQANQGVGFALVARDAATGKEVFSSRRSLSAWNILGTPCLVPGAAVASAPATPASPASPASAPAIQFADGFAAAAPLLSLNGNSPKIVGKNLQLTDGKQSEQAAAFFRTPVSVAAFNTSFRFKPTKAAADGMTFTIQGAGPESVGAPGDGLGFQGIAKSVAVKFDLHANGGNQSTTGMYVNGASPTSNGEANLADAGIDLHSGHEFIVKLSYDGTTLQSTIQDVETKANNTQSYAVNIPEVVGGPTAYVGFTAATGLQTAVQEVLDWTYTAGAPPKADTHAQDMIYVAASRTGQGRELSILMLSAKDGKLIKSIALGSYAVDQNQVYGDRLAQPTLLVSGDRLYIDTHGGALVAMQPRSGAIEWGTLYDSTPPLTGYYYNYQPPPLGMSGPLLAGGLLFTKGMRSTRLLGLQTDGPTLKWNRPVSKTAILIGADDERLYLGGEELTAYSLKTKELLWATQLPLSAGWGLPLLTKNRLYQFTSRGICEVNATTGEVVNIFRGADLDSYGGTMLLTPKAVVTVSNLAITAYPRQSPSDKPEQK